MRRHILAAAILVAGSAAAGAVEPPLFVDETTVSGVEHTYTGGWEYFVGGGAAVFDCNGDAYPDLFLAGGSSPSRLLVNGSEKGGAVRFRPASGLPDGLDNVLGAYPLDVDGDGLLDLIVVNRAAPAQVWRNAGFGTAGRPGPAGNWVALKVEQPGANRNAVGAWIEVRVADRTQRKEITVGGGHAGGIATWHHFGVGVAERLRLRVQCPDGEWSPWIRLFANQFARISRGETEAALWLPPSMAKTALK